MSVSCNLLFIELFYEFNLASCSKLPSTQLAQSARDKSAEPLGDLIFDTSSIELIAFAYRLSTCHDGSEMKVRELRIETNRPPSPNITPHGNQSQRAPVECIRLQKEGRRPNSDSPVSVLDFLFILDDGGEHTETQPKSRSTSKCQSYTPSISSWKDRRPVLTLRPLCSRDLRLNSPLSPLISPGSDHTMFWSNWR